MISDDHYISVLSDAYALSMGAQAARDMAQQCENESQYHPELEQSVVFWHVVARHLERMSAQAVNNGR